MALRRPEEYLESLRDGRKVYMNGKIIKDVTTAPIFKEAAEHLALSFRMTHDEDRRHHVVATCPETNEEIAAFYLFPRNTDDLLKRREAIYEVSRYGEGYNPFIKEIGTDAIFALRMILPQVDRKYGTGYAERARRYHHFAQAEDLALAGAVTDPKGDRSLRPHQQAVPDVFLRVVEKREDGIVVEGAKCHITSSPLSNELLVLPTRNMVEEDADYAVAFAIPVDTPGLTFIANPEHYNNDVFERPMGSKHPIIHAMIIFDRVFVPWERVFMCGEWDFAGPLALAFASWHRFTGLCYKGPVAELMLGAAYLIADFNGVAKASNVKSKLRELVIYIENIYTYSKLACHEYQEVEGIAWPNPLHCNIGKYLFADNYHLMIKYLQEIAGGIGGTCPSAADYRHPDLHEKLDRYLCGREGVTTEQRLRLVKLIRDITATCDSGVHMFGTVHGEGTLEAQRIMIMREFDMKPCIELALRAAEISAG
jgi:4-hydroxybutyryl-CoA dehydratase / vinylacetyl-CoA-Delta-isomerase